ncbi:histidinol-phosphate transaminase [Tamlana sp. 2_MG-2023]|uniref:histidinol-phosphate transaminase n=1 Tax=unclassified Tamlana TaxID=2614803 RepID=UPI0026E18CA1|nr:MULTISPECIES: histidinol-phosphate transaminase [unclassified Tamlana]MDO6759447.1 histidinol-phosphate transaminase [Tamlana sp. 2_MG-2023]MDO6790414.1 histidinol-phosphate transaminase [Tamlana sp. 1_MG-2023]
MTTNFNLNNITRPVIKALKPYSSARDEFQGNSDAMVFLDANENPYENGVNRYPDPQQRNVKGLLSEIKGVSTKNILLGNGSDEVLDLIFRAFCEPNQDNVITLPPTYGMYSVLANINAIEIQEIQLDAHFQPKVDAILETVNEKSKLLFLCSPNNPTGNSFEAASISKLIDNFKGIVVIDEAYIDFSNEESWVSRLAEFPNLIVTQTLSKAYGMAGIRLGICYASEAIISVLNRLKPPYNVNELTQQKAIVQLQNKELTAQQIKSILEERSLLIEALKKVDYVSEIYPSDANFILAKVDDATKRYNQLIEKGIVIRNRTTQPGCENTLRFTVGRPDENKILIETLKSI